ncbi:hypothetical protein M405DRAFT_819205 [Rhizopogon salebrosus TDB-379]|nr:hypothetical protein M405DRAFT_819205 [Rhizopogon salebrosus TDB-379]
MGSLDDTYGALLLGVIVSAMLYGVTCAQTWYYFNHYPSDPWYIKISVGLILVSDSANQALVTHTVYTYLVTDFGLTGNIIWSLPIEVLFNAFTAFIVQCFFTIRIYTLSHKSIIPTACVLSLVISEFVVIIVYVAKAVKLTSIVEISEIKLLSISVNVLAASGDVLITVILCTLFQQARTGFRASDTMINKLIMFSISTGLLTSICAVMCLICIIVWPGAFYYVAFFFCLGRFYCNSLLATLNARKSLRGDSQCEDIPLSLQGA